MAGATLPLAGVRVLDLTRLLPGGVCTMMLVDLGADVVKVEDPFGGDYARWGPPMIGGQGAYFRMNNRGKRAIILDLKRPAGAEVLRTLVKTADVLVESFRPGVMARLGLDAAALRAVNPRLVYCALSGWGADGPSSADAGHDLNYASEAGLVGAMATPGVPGGQVADIGGAYIAVAGILAALLRRATTGEGGVVDVGLAEAALPFGLFNWVEALYGGPGELRGAMACYRIYKTRDDGHVALAALEPKFWANFCHAVERPDLIGDYRDAARQPYLIAELSELFAARTREEWARALAGVECCFSVVASPGALTNNPQFAARGMLGRFADGAPWMRSPLRLDEAEPALHAAAPGYGQHSREILREAGYGDAEIEALIAARAVGDALPDPGQ